MGLGIYKFGRHHQIRPFTGVRDRGDDDQARLRRSPPSSSRQRHQPQGRHQSARDGSRSNPIKKCES